jgi:hypothetical protein
VWGRAFCETLNTMNLGAVVSILSNLSTQDVGWLSIKFYFLLIQSASLYGKNRVIIFLVRLDVSGQWIGILLE